MGKKDNFISAAVLRLAGGSVFQKPEKEDARFEYWALQWLENVKLRVKESSYVKYRNMVHNHILPDLGQYRIRDMATEAVEQFVQRKFCSGKKDASGGLSEKTVKDILAVLKQICLYISYQDMEVPCHFELIKIRCPHSEVQILKRQDRLALERFLLSDNSLTKTGILLSLYMGLRVGEVCALKKKHILYKEKILCVRSTMQRIQNFEGGDHKKTKIVVTEPKTSSSARDIPIPLFLMDRLELLKDRPEEAYVLTGEKDTFIEPRTLENILEKCLRECQMEHVHFHALRHTFATRCVEDGFDVKSLSEILGHSNVNVTLNRYVHSSMEQKRKNMSKLFCSGSQAG